MNRKTLFTLGITTFISLLYSQDALCPPEDVLSTSYDSSLRLEWIDPGGDGGSGDELLFFECFEFCMIPEIAQIEHVIDNGGGGWYRNFEGGYFCTFGPDCELTPNGEGFSAPGFTPPPSISVDSRMIFGPIDIPDSSDVVLGFLEFYASPELQSDFNTVEISVNGTDAWETIYSSDALSIGAGNFIPTSINISDFGGQEIYLSFRYISSGNTETWLVDQLKIESYSQQQNLSNDHSTENQTRIYNTEYETLLFSINERISSISSQLSVKEQLLNKKSSDIGYTYFPVNTDRLNLNKNRSESISNNRDCSDPENQTEVSIVLTSGNYPEEITWSIADSISGSTILSGTAPYDTIICLYNGVYTLTAEDEFDDSWNGAFMTIASIDGATTYLDYSLAQGYSGETQSFYVGPLYGCTDIFAENFNPAANMDDGSCTYEDCSQNRTLTFCSEGFYPEEITWEILDSDGNRVHFGLAGEQKQLCLGDGYYKVKGYDSWGDGWNGASLTAIDTAFNLLFDFTFNTGNSDSLIFYAGNLPGCTDPYANNYNPLATTDDGSCVYFDCNESQGFVMYLDGDSVDYTYSNYYLFEGLQNGKEYEMGVSTVYLDGNSEIISSNNVPWDDVSFYPLVLEMDTLINGNYLQKEFEFTVDGSVVFMSEFSISSPERLVVDTTSATLFSNFNSDNFINMYDPSGIFGGLWQLGNTAEAASYYFTFDESMDSSSFAWINDDGLGGGGAAHEAYLISNEINNYNEERLFITVDIYFPNPNGSCDSDGIGSGTGGEGYSEELHLMVSNDFGANWVMIDSTMSGGPGWVSRMYEITEYVEGMDTFIAGLYYTDCGGNWAYGVAVDNFAVHIADDDEVMAINPYAGWAYAGSTHPVTVSLLNNPSGYSDTELQLTAAWDDTLLIPVVMGIDLQTDEGDIQSLPTGFVLKQNYPNPFNPSTTIPFQITDNSQVTLTIFNLLGEKVSTLIDNRLTSGSYKASWDGKSSNGSVMSAGIYLYELKCNGHRDTGKMILLK